MLRYMRVHVLMQRAGHLNNSGLTESWIMSGRSIMHRHYFLESGYQNLIVLDGRLSFKPMRFVFRAIGVEHQINAKAQTDAQCAHERSAHDICAHGCLRSLRKRNRHQVFLAAKSELPNGRDGLLNRLWARRIGFNHEFSVL